MNVTVLDEPLHAPIKVYPPGSVKITDITSRMYAEREGKLGKDDPMDFMRFEAGFLWEEILREGLRNRWMKLHPDFDYAGHKPDSFQVDNIWMGMDYMNPDDEWPLEDWKATKTSIKNNFAEKNWYWLPQFMGYAYGAWKLKMVPPEKVGRFRVRIWYINGDYSYQSKTSDFTLLQDYVSLGLTFSKRELMENWQKLLSHGRRYGLLPTQPTFTEAECQTKKSDSKPPATSRSRTPSTPRTGRILKMSPRRGSSE